MTTTRVTRAPGASLALLAAGAVVAPAALGAQEVPYVPTPMPVVDKMLELAAPAPGDSLYDLGSGDGRIVIAAARRHSTPGVGVEIDPDRVELSRTHAEEAGVDDLVRFIEGDLFEVDVSPATIVTLYLLPSVNERLRPKLFRELRPGTRVVSHDFDMGAWRADSVVSAGDDASMVFYWVIPADAAGTWRVSLPSTPEFSIRLEQEYQRLEGAVVEPEGDLTVEEPRIRGTTVSFRVRAVGSAPDAGVRLRGTVDGDRISGTTPEGESWSAVRTTDAREAIYRR